MPYSRKPLPFYRFEFCPYSDFMAIYDFVSPGSTGVLINKGIDLTVFVFL